MVSSVTRVVSVDTSTSSPVDARSSQRAINSSATSNMIEW
jgi:hypothetical protein